MDPDTFDQDVSGIAALEHPVSRRAFELLIEQEWIGRDAAAKALGVARSVAAFHLDKLVEAGLLEARYERTSGRTGPGAGRPAKFYGRSKREIEVSLPPRRYDLVGALLADAVTRAEDGAPIATAVAEVAHESGVRVGQGATRPAGSTDRACLVDLLVKHGYEPQERQGDIALANCPFHKLAENHRQLVCGMNLDFVAGILDGLGADGLNARLAPEPGCCCVRIGAA